jgi:hypothetical protein
MVILEPEPKEFSRMYPDSSLRMRLGVHIRRLYGSGKYAYEDRQYVPSHTSIISCAFLYV